MPESANEERTGNGKGSMVLIVFGLFVVIAGLIITLIGWFAWATGIGAAMLALGLLCCMLGAWRVYHYRCGLVDQDENQGESRVYTIEPYTVQTQPPPSYTPYDDADDRHRFPGLAYPPPPQYDGSTNPNGIVNTPRLMPYHTASVPWTESAVHVPPPSYEEAVRRPSTLIYQPEGPSVLQEQPKDDPRPVNRSDESGQGTNES